MLSAPRSEPSPIDHPFFVCLSDELSVKAPVVPAFIAAITDARYLRQRGIPAYHTSDEHISLEAFAQGVETLWKVVRQCTRS